jgi:transposase
MGRGDLSDAEWELIGPLLPPERGRWARPAGDNRRFLNGLLHGLRVGCAWRDMHERCGKWNSVYVRFRRWAEQGIWDALLQTLGLTDDWQHMIDSTSVRGHVSAAGGKGGSVRALCDHSDYRRYRDRNRVERIFGKLKQQRRIATRSDKTVLSSESFLNLAATRLWLKSFVNTA